MQNTQNEIQKKTAREKNDKIIIRQQMSKSKSFPIYKLNANGLNSPIRRNRVAEWIS